MLCLGCRGRRLGACCAPPCQWLSMTSDAGRRPLYEPDGGRFGLGKAAAIGTTSGEWSSSCGPDGPVWSVGAGAAGWWSRNSPSRVVPTTPPGWRGRGVSAAMAGTTVDAGRGPCARRNRPWRSLPAGPRVRPGRWQVFGLSGPDPSIHLLSVASQAIGPVLVDGGRSRTPLRGSPGFPPGSLLPLHRRGRRRRTSARPTLRHSGVAVRDAGVS